MLFQNLAEFHAHMGGSVATSTLWEIAHASGYPMGNLSINKENPIAREIHYRFDSFSDFHKFLSVQDSSHMDFLEKYFPLTERLQSGPQAVELSAFHAIAKAYRRNEGRLSHMELRFDPLKRCHNNWYKPEAIVQAALKGLRRAQDCYNVTTKLILCMDRNYSGEDKFAVVKLAIENECHGVDVSGIEIGQEADADWLAYNFLPSLATAADNGLVITYHVGEVWTQHRANPVLNVIKVLPVTRIGHGIAALSCLNEMTSGQIDTMRRVTFEVCPTVNLVTHVCEYDTLATALGRAMAVNVRFTINTDNPYLVNTTLTKEYELVQKMLGDQAKACMEHCLNSALHLINQ